MTDITLLTLVFFFAVGMIFGVWLLIYGEFKVLSIKYSSEVIDAFIKYHVLAMKRVGSSLTKETHKNNYQFMVTVDNFSNMSYNGALHQKPEVLAEKLVYHPKFLYVEDLLFTAKDDIHRNYRYFNRRAIKGNRRLRPYYNLAEIVHRHGMITHYYPPYHIPTHTIKLTKFKIYLDFIYWLTIEKIVILHKNITKKHEK